MNNRTSLLIISLLLMLSSCSSREDYSSFISEDTNKYNNQIASAIDVNEAWATTPYLIIGKLFGPEYRTEGNSGFSLEQTEISNEHIRIIVTQEGLLDDSVHGEKRIIEFKYKANRWVIDNIKLGFKCQSGRGQQKYSGELCS
ncbi:hypothetical protein [Pontibacter beigongshangensis]|uniref:hypothetical protein n=1 Tax=Pontibacter beigongshangensis TaxID=2574733 RepID=UPI001650A5C1|nr:hypothetical protein [Pontibacter beigongshangensis]